MDSNPFKPPANEKLYTLKELATDKRSIVRRTYATLKDWMYDGAVNLSGDRVRLEVWKVANVNHTSLEAIERFIALQNAQSAQCRIIGGCMDGKDRSISDHIERITTAQLSPDSPVPADELYHHRKYIDKKGEVRHFLIWAGVENQDEVALKLLGAE